MRKRYIITVIVMILALVSTLALFVMTRFGSGEWGVNIFGNKISGLSAYELVTKQQKMISDLKILKSDYAQKIVDYQSQLAKISSSTELTEVEKQERKNKLNQIYSKKFFAELIAKIDQKEEMLTKIEQEMCRFTCADYAG